MENPPFVVHKFGYLRSSQIVKNGLTKPKGMNITLTVRNKRSFSRQKVCLDLKTDHPKTRLKIQKAISNKFAACWYVTLCSLID